MICKKCKDELTKKEEAIGKEKCVKCLVRGYKFMLGQLYRENEELEKKLRKEK